MLWSGKQKYFDSLSTAGNKQFCKTVKLLNKQQVSIPTLNQDGVSADTDKEKSDILNEYFLHHVRLRALYQPLSHRQPNAVHLDTGLIINTQ